MSNAMFDGSLIGRPGAAFERGVVYGNAARILAASEDAVCKIIGQRLGAIAFRYFQDAIDITRESSHLAFAYQQLAALPLESPLPDATREIFRARADHFGRMATSEAQRYI